LEGNCIFEKSPLY